MAGLAVGGAVAKNIGGTLDQTMNASGNVPPANSYLLLSMLLSMAKRLDHLKLQKSSR